MMSRAQRVLVVVVIDPRWHLELRQEDSLAASQVFLTTINATVVLLTNVSGNGLKKAKDTNQDKPGHAIWNNIYNQCTDCVILITILCLFIVYVSIMENRGRLFLSKRVHYAR